MNTPATLFTMPLFDARAVSETATATSASASSVSPSRPGIADLSGLLKGLDKQSVGALFGIVAILAGVWLLVTM